MRITLNIWRQRSASEPGRMIKYQMDDVSTHMSFLEMLDVLNERLTEKARSPSPSITIAVKASVGCADS